ncbi:glutamyl-tRNA amidotransferase, partial [Pseudomonas syringae pv. tagetis]
SITSYMSIKSTNNSKFAGGEEDYGISVLFSSMQLEQNDLDSFFEPELKNLGQLQTDEMYGNVTALAL